MNRRRVPHLVHDFLHLSADARPDAPAVVHESERRSYGDIESASNRIARLLVRRGVRPGDRVGLLAQNSVLYVEAYYAILKAGGIVVSLNTAGDARTLQELLRDCGASALIVGPRFGEVVGHALGGLPDLRILLAGRGGVPEEVPAHVDSAGIEESDVEPGGSPPGVRRIDLDCAAIVYTSGSTGKPRGAVLTHLNIAANTNSIVEYLELTEDDRVLVVLPFYYVYGKSLLNTHIRVGASIVIENRFLFPQVAVDTLAREEATGFSGVPSTFAILLNRTNFARRDLPRLRYVTQAGGPMAPELIRRLVEALPGRKVFIMYGATEASARLSYLDPEALPGKIGSIGRPIPNVDLRVLRDDGSPAAPGEVGEIVARGSNIMEGYWADPVETEKVLDGSGFRTGDLGWADEDGFLFVAGRKRDMVKSGGHRIHPKEIEEALLEHPEVHEVAVIGIPDEVLGEAIKAFVVLRAGTRARETDLEEFCSRRLPAFKVPKVIEVRADLPKNPSGKILKEVLRTETCGASATNEASRLDVLPGKS